MSGQTRHGTLFRESTETIMTAGGSGGGSGTAPAPAAAAVKFSTHPFDNNINPGTLEGQKLWKQATSSLDTRIALNITNLKQIITQLNKDCHDFRWGELVNKVDISMTNSQSLMTNSTLVSFDAVQKQASITWHDSTLDYDHAPVLSLLASRTVAE